MSRKRKGFTSRKDEVLRALKANRRKGLQAAAIEVSGAAKENTPVDTGRLRASIAWAADGQSRRHSDTQGGTTITYDVGAPEGTALIGTNVEYAPQVHENLQASHVTGQAKFLETAAREKKARALQLIRSGLRGEL